VALETQRIRVLVVDDHAGMRDGISAMVNTQADMVVAGTASDGRQAIEQFRTLQPDVMIVDWNLPIISGDEVIATLMKEFPQARFIAITALNDDSCIQRAMDLGAKAYIHKDMLRRELLAAIRAVHRGQQHFPEKPVKEPKKEN
jgi:two-component system NarL family response regulator